MSADVLTPAILSYITHTTYPDSEAVSSAHVDSSTLTHLLAALRQEQDAAKEEIRALSKSAAPDIDAWIARAKDLQADILRSRETARRIVEEAEAGRDLRADVEDKAKKVALLEKEVAFQDVLAGTLEHVQYANGLLEATQEAAVRGDVESARAGLEEAYASIGGLESIQGTRAVGVLREKGEELKGNLMETSTECWNALLLVDADEHRITVRQDGLAAELLDAAVSEISLEQIVHGLKGLDAFDALVRKFGKDIDRTILKPRMTVNDDGLIAKLTVSGDDITAAGTANDVSSTALFGDLHNVLDFFATRLPPSVAVPVSEALIPALTTRLEDQWLEAAFPLRMSDMSAFTSLLNDVSALAEQIDSYGWHGADELRKWIENAPRSWLTKRREAVLGEVRNLVFAGLGERKVVERVETRMMRKEYPAVAASAGGGGTGGASEGVGGEDDWDTAWDEAQEEPAPAAVPQRQARQRDNDDEDDTAWDEEEDSRKRKDGSEEGDAEDDAWGWGDDDTPSKNPPSPVSTKKQPSAPSTNPNENPTPPAEQEMTLRETFTVTSIPDGILATLQQIVSDAETLSGPAFAHSPVAPTAQALYTLPTLALAIYRATAPTAYGKLAVGNILIYNDALRLSDQLRTWQTTRPASSKLRLDADLAALEAFAKRAYAAEMDAQRTILRDLLDGAQGFANCTTPPFKRECESAVQGTIDRLKDVRELWKGVLSEGALLQSLGSLVSTVTGKMVSEIEDLGDIGEAESRGLRSLCDRVGEVRAFFSSHNGPEGKGGGEGGQQEEGERKGEGEEHDMTFIYAPTWLKFQYLAEILDSSLADIRWMWREGGLGLEFEAEEVVELVEALFAESELRRQAVREIRRGR